MSRIRLRAHSIIHPGNLLVQNSNGECYVYFASTGELSATPIHSSLAEAMIQSYEWREAQDSEWVSDLEFLARPATLLPGESPPDRDPMENGI